MLQITQFIKIIANNKDDKIKLLRNQEVVRWLFDDLSFIREPNEKYKYNFYTNR